MQRYLPEPQFPRLKSSPFALDYPAPQFIVAKLRPEPLNCLPTAPHQHALGDEVPALLPAYLCAIYVPEKIANELRQWNVFGLQHQLYLPVSVRSS